MPLVPTAPATAPGSATSFALSSEDARFLEEMEKANFQFFWDQANPENGLIRDRADVHTDKNNTVASIAGTGFGLTALCIAQANGWVSLRDARVRAIALLRCLARKMPTHRGFFYHWADLKTGERVWDSEV